MARPLKVGAVMYDPKVSVIWEIIRDFFDQQPCPIDLRFYSTYEDPLYPKDRIFLNPIAASALSRAGR